MEARRLRGIWGRSKRTWYEDNTTHSRRLTLPDIETIVFGQQTAGTIGYFEQLVGQAHTIPLTQFPHFISLSQTDRDASETTYAEYLRLSWKYLGWTDKERRIVQRVQSFRSFHEAIRLIDRMDKPIYVCERPDGLLLLIDGNHRAAVALYEGLEIEARFVDESALLAARARLPKIFYGSGHRGIPYQSLYSKGEELVAGRRRDMLERIDLVDKVDIEGKHILDLGANIGGNAFLAAESGATRITAVDSDPALITAAARINAYMAVPLHHLLHDLSVPLTLEEPADTTFCFAVLEHVQAKDVLLNSLITNTTKVAYVEGHPGQNPEELQSFLESFFAQVKLLALCNDGVHTRARTRPFFRCELRA